MGRFTIQPEGSAVDAFSAVSAADITDTTSTAVKAAAAGTRYFITDVSISNLHATVATRVDILDGATVIWSGPASANGGGYVHRFATPLVGSVNTAVNVKCGTTGAAVRAAISGYSKTN